MKLERTTKLLVEPPAVATGDIAFNLIVFFLVCASQQPSTGRQQLIPQADAKQQATEQSQNMAVEMVNVDTLTINGNKVRDADFVSKLRAQIAGKKRPEDRVVVVKSAKDVPYKRWIQVTNWIEDAGGTITLQLEEEKTILTN